ncbi:MAG: Ig-like domain-containing protein [Nitrospiraceae bacterium]|nr:Ig-like domain-containing protein [Nitrospiraceae bacterium]
MKALFVIALSLVLFSCSSEKAADTGAGKTGQEPASAAGQASPIKQAAPEYSLEVVPANADRNSTLATIPHGFSETGAKIEWLVNGNLVASGNVYKPSGAVRGDTVQAKITVNGRDVSSNIIHIMNTPPAMTKVKIMPEVFKPGDTLYVDAEAKDIDGDNVTILYEWTRNGEPAGNGKTIEGPLKRGDKIVIKITPFDNEAYGAPITLTREFRNMPPTITGHTKTNFDGKLWTYQVKASDPDGDPLTYALKEGPKGMTIDPDSGLITWNVPDDFTGKTTFSVKAEDGHGGEASYAAKVTIKSAAEK